MHSVGCPSSNRDEILICLLDRNKHQVQQHTMQQLKALLHLAKSRALQSQHVAQLHTVLCCLQLLHPKSHTFLGLWHVGLPSWHTTKTNMRTDMHSTIRRGSGFSVLWKQHGKAENLMLVCKGAVFIPSHYCFTMADVESILGCVRPCTTSVTCAVGSWS